jgi:hypothetical protein
VAFPAVSGMTENQDAGNTTTHPVVIPPLLGVDRILLFVEFHEGAFGPLQGHPAGFVTVYSPVTRGQPTIRAFVYVSALLPVLGVERYRPLVPGGTIVLTSPQATRSCIYAIAFADPLLLSQFKFAQSGGGATALDPPNLVYSTTSKEVLWWAMGSGGQFNFGAHPPGYTLYQHDGETRFPDAFGSFGDCAISARELTAASENPGAFIGTGPTSDWGAVTMGVSLQLPTTGTPNTYQAVKDTHATYADVQSDYANYDEMAVGP